MLVRYCNEFHFSWGKRNMVVSFDFDSTAFAGNCRFEAPTVFQCDRNELVAPLFLFLFTEPFGVFRGRKTTTGKAKVVESKPGG